MSLEQWESDLAACKKSLRVHQRKVLDLESQKQSLEKKISKEKASSQGIVLEECKNQSKVASRSVIERCERKIDHIDTFLGLLFFGSLGFMLGVPFFIDNSDHFSWIVVGAVVGAFLLVCALMHYKSRLKKVMKQEEQIQRGMKGYLKKQWLGKVCQVTDKWKSEQ